jgi:hypothetical protein
MEPEIGSLTGAGYSEKSAEWLCQAQRLGRIYQFSKLSLANECLDLAQSGHAARADRWLVSGAKMG